MDKTTATQAAVNAVSDATKTINTYGPNTLQARIAYKRAVAKTLEARAAGATDHDLRSTPPAA